MLSKRIFITFVVMITETANYDLSPHNTFGMKVKCALYIEYDNASDLEKIDWDSLPQPVMHIGGGSNLLFTGDFPGTVLHSKIKYIKYKMCFICIFIIINVTIFRC